jgi:SET domain-containing protein
LNNQVAGLALLVRRRSAISGWGVYAAQPIEKDARIGEYKGELISHAEGGRMERRGSAFGCSPSTDGGSGMPPVRTVIGPKDVTKRNARTKTSR